MCINGTHRPSMTERIDRAHRSNASIERIEGTHRRNASKERIHRAHRGNTSIERIEGISIERMIERMTERIEGLSGTRMSPRHIPRGMCNARDDQIAG
jgi:hypothetical protein